MIITQSNGRKKSILTPEELDVSTKSVLANLTLEERELLFALDFASEKGDSFVECELEQEVAQHVYHTKPVSIERFVTDSYYLGESCATMYPELKKDLVSLFEYPYREVVNTGAIGVGKCEAGDNETVWYETGERITVREAAERYKERGHARTYGFSKDGSGVDWHECKYIESGYKQIGDLRLWSGCKTGLTPDHPILTPNGYKKVSELKKGDSVATARNLPTGQGLDIADDEIKFVAYMLTDRGGCGDNLIFNESNDKCLLSLLNVIDNLGGHVEYKACRKGSLSISILGLKPLMDKYDFYILSKARRVPAIFYGLDNRQLGLFLNIVWSCNGWITHESNGWSLGISFDSEDYIHDIQQLLLRFGVISKYNRKFKAWSLQVLGADNVKLFLDNVGVLLDYKNQCEDAKNYAKSVISFSSPESHDWRQDVFWDKIDSYTLRRDKEYVYDREVPDTHNFVTNGLIVHNTYIASIALSYIFYTLSCMINPQKVFGLSSGTEMVVVLISKNLTLAREVLKSGIDDKLKESPYFMTKFTPDFRRDFTLFPNNIRMTIGSYTSDRVLGTNVFSAIMDETNFPPKRKAQQIATGFGQKSSKASFDIVEKVYRSMVRRIKSRFQVAGGGFPGMVILASSAATVDSFTERKIRESVNDSSVFVRDHTQWTVKPKENFCGEMFYVLCSTSATKSRILREDEYDLITDEYMNANDVFIMDIPIEFKEDFENNMEESLRDIAGFSTEAISQFMQRTDTIEDAISGKVEHCFSANEWMAGTRELFDWNKLCIQFERKLTGGYTEIAYKPRLNSQALRWVHVDTSISGDSSGMAIAHIDKWVEVVRRDSEGNKHTDVAPYYIVDFMLRINPPPAEQIYMPDIRAMIYQFMEHGYRFIGLSTDTYQYIEMHQQIKRKGIKPYLVSMDKTVDPYMELKSAFYEHRIEIYNYKPFIEEFKLLEYDRLVGKIDHPLAGSKDVADAVAGAIWGLKKSGARMPVLGIKDGQENMVKNNNNWVSPLIPAEHVNAREIGEAIKDAKKDSVEAFMPILFGD